MSLFPVNIQINPSDIITLDTLCDKATYIYDLKRIIVNEQQLISVDNIKLKYNSIFMNDNNTLEYYGIYDSKHIIKLYFNVQGSNKSDYPPKKYSYISNNTSSSFHIQVPLLLKNKNTNNHRLRCRCRRPTFKEYMCIIGFFSLIFLGIFIAATIAFKQQSNIFAEYSNGSNDCEVLNKICNDYCDKFHRNDSNVFKIAFFINILYISFLLAFIIFCGIIALTADNDEDHYCFNCIKFGCTYCISVGLFALQIASVVYTSYMIWKDLVRIRQNCDRDTPFYQGIMKWVSIDFMYTFTTYIMLVIFVWICISPYFDS